MAVVFAVLAPSVNRDVVPRRRSTCKSPVYGHYLPVRHGVHSRPVTGRASTTNHQIMRSKCLVTGEQGHSVLAGSGVDTGHRDLYVMKTIIIIN
ncbi:Uncharacterised protein [Mycobacteroides abscessus subsp. abscessus]|nr:Uncharacterised protein [Mycobacteroides abscessus subsp. abscessus]